MVGMPRSTDWIIAHQDEIAAAFENYEPRPGDIRDPGLLRTLRDAPQRLPRLESEIHAAVAAARAGGYSWAMIGARLGIGAEAARRRYTQSV